MVAEALGREGPVFGVDVIALLKGSPRTVAKKSPCKENPIAWGSLISGAPKDVEEVLRR